MSGCARRYIYELESLLFFLVERERERERWKNRRPLSNSRTGELIEIRTMRGKKRKEAQKEGKKKRKEEKRRAAVFNWRRHARLTSLISPTSRFFVSEPEPLASGGGPELAGVHGAEMVSAAATALPVTNERDELQFINFSLRKIHSLFLSFSFYPPTLYAQRCTRAGQPASRISRCEK